MYDYNDCVEGLNVKRSKKCSHKDFPMHPHLRMREACGSVLLKTVEMSSGNRILYPYMMYCYIGLKHSIGSLLSRPNIFRKCGEWKIANNSCLLDVYDGRIWQMFQSKESLSLVIPVLLD